MATRKSDIQRALMPRRTDNLLSSIGSLYLAIVIFVSIYAYVGVSLYEHNQAASNLVTVDKLLALRYLANPSGYEVREAKLNDLPEYFSQAASEKIQEFMPLPEPDEPDELSEPELDRVDKPLTESAFTDAKIEGSHIIKIPMRLAAGATCDVLVTELSAGRDFSIFGHTIKSENVRMFSFSRCAPILSVFFFPLKDRQFAFSVPTVGFPALPASRPFGRVGTFREIDEVKKLLPATIAKYVNLFSPYVTVDIGVIEAEVLSYANSRLGKFFPPHDLENAAQKLYEEKEKDASYLGISASYSQLIRVGPLIYFAWSFLLWRRVRQLPVGRIRTERYWFGLDTRDLVGRVYAYLCGLAPLLFGILFYVLFSVSQDMGLRVFDRFVTLKGIVTLQFPFAPLLGGGSTDYLAMVFGLVFLPFQILTSVVTVRKLFQVINANSPRNRPRDAASGPA